MHEIVDQGADNAPPVRFATAGMLPQLLALAPSEVELRLNHLPFSRAARDVVNPSDPSQIAAAYVFDVTGCRTVEANRTEPPRPFKRPPESVLEKFELKRRMEIFRHAVAAHGHFLRLHSLSTNGTCFAEFGHVGEPWPGSQTLLVTLVQFLEDPALTIFLKRSTLDETLLAEAVASIVPRLDLSLERSSRAVRLAVKDWRSDLDIQMAKLDPEAQRLLIEEMREAAGKAVVLFAGEKKSERFGLLVQRSLSAIRSKALATVQLAEATARFDQKTGYDRYPALFPLARSMGRKILFLAGPTNSGKTHDAMRLAIEAEAAEILSPLRLLALEHRELLQAGGRSAGLVTGEEIDVDPGCTHIARTIETIDLGRQVPVAVIDEIQMLDDPARGWAWTQALVGAPAELLVLTGSPSAIPLVERIASVLGEPLDIRQYERKTPLTVASAPISVNELRSGDALIAFTRRTVHDFRVLARSTGLSIATIYGALGPEVRRSESNRFRTGEADALIATDAIGMGLNLPIRRIVFTTIEKFDGVSTRKLLPAEILQIAGRAGRFGHFEGGEVTVLNSPKADKHLAHIGAAIAKGPAKLDGKAYVRPNLPSIEACAELLGTTRLGPILRHLVETLVRKHPDLRMADLSDDILKADRLDQVDLPLSVRYAYVITPLSLKSPNSLDLIAGWATSHLKRGQVEPFELRRTMDLEWMEHSAHLATVWLWLSRRFPEIYRDAAQVRQDLAALTAEIEARLSQSSGLKLSPSDSPTPTPEL